MKTTMTILSAFAAVAALAAEPEPKNVPELMTTKSGEKVTSV